MKKNIVFVSISVILLILLGIGLSYSMWNMSASQETSNVIASSECFDISITSQENNINLQNAYPISNEKGKSLTPFTFTVTNVCETASKYSINLESLKGSTLSSAFLDVMLNNGEIKRLNTYSSANKVNSSSIESRELETGILGNKESKDYSLRLWIDYDITMEDLNNETKVLKSKIVVIGTPTNYTGSTIFNFDYTGGEQTFTAPVSGTYRLETWGAQGGDTSMSGKNAKIGGAGGFSSGNINLLKNEIMYINIAGKGNGCIKSSENVNHFGALCNGGYNGGGSSLSNNLANDNAGTGGGATHIALESGLLSSFVVKPEKILIVASGGGGSYSWKDVSYAANGGEGGGIIGNNGYLSSFYSNYLPGYGGTQTMPGQGGTLRGEKGTFGQGGNGGNCGSAGGGGGFYGGGASAHNGAGGGSSYIGNPLLKDKVMYCYNCEESNEESTKTISTTCSEETPTSNCAKKGNGYARITLVSIEE